VLRTVRWFLALAVVLADALFVSAPSQAYTAHGKRCTIVGTPHKDVLVGTGHRDVICGRGGNDVIRARGGNDVVEGGPGRDRIDGGPGADVLRGSAGDDTIVGGGGGDDLYGEAGNDDLDGGAAADDVFGGTGTNWCTVGAGDDTTACVYDRSAPVVTSATLSATTVDVTNGAREVTVRVHVVDDTGVASVRLQGDLALGSGTVRNGWWSGTVTVAQWAPPGVMPLMPTIRDRAGRWAAPDDLPVRLTVVDRAADLQAPTVTKVLSPTPTASVDVRTAAAKVVVKTQVSDSGSGISYVSLCLYHPTSWGYTNLPCTNGDLVGGTIHDGAWQTTITIPKGSPGGAWDVAVVPADRAGNQRSYGGTHLVDESTTALPGGGTFTVLGVSDTHAPTLTGLTMTPVAVDTLTASAHIAVRATVTDVEGATAVFAVLTGEPAADWSIVGSPLVDLTLTSGTAQSGTWTGTLTLPQGAPPGTYWLQVGVSDTRHFVSYMSSGSPQWVDDSPVPGNDRVTVVPHA
jgi:hypothetical protein